MTEVRRFAVTLAVALAVTAPAVAHAQAVYLDRKSPHTIQLEILKPDPDGEDALSFSSSAWYFTGRMEFSPSLHAVAELPMGTSGYEGLGGFSDGVIVGNPYVGLEAGSAPSTALGEFGVRLPFAGGAFTTLAVGLLSDTDRWTAWVPDVMTLRAGLRLRSHPSASGLWVEGRVAPELWIGTDEFSGTEVWSTYGVNVRIDKSAVRTGAGLSGRITFPGLDGQDFGEASFHQAEFVADFLKGRVRPGVSLRLPLDEDLKADLAAVYGVSVSYAP